MYFTSGAKVRTRRSRTERSFVRRYSFQRARVSSEESRRFEVCAVARLMTLLLGAGGRLMYRAAPEPSASPISGIGPLDMWPDVHPHFWGCRGSNLHRTP